MQSYQSVAWRHAAGLAISPQPTRHGLRPPPPLGTALLLALLVVPGAAPWAGQPLWGYGVRACGDYLKAAEAADNGDKSEMQRYEDWLGGFFSALNLALGEDVLRGSGVRSAMRGTRDYCRAHADQDMFNAAMDHVRSLSSLR